MAENHCPRIYETGVVSSVLDTAREPGWAEKLEVFDSLTALRQTAGRGQYRRAWSSPEGNIYAVLRLPMTEPFAGTEAAVALGAWMAQGLRDLGYPALVKWPNDVVLPEDDEGHPGPAKVCGILLEERAGVLLAGVGVNVAAAPSAGELRAEHAAGAASLSAYAARHGMALPEAGDLWKRLVNALFSSYCCMSLPSLWMDTANALLLWRGTDVILEEDGRIFRGILSGVGSRGDLALRVQGELKHFLSGGLRSALWEK